MPAAGKVFNKKTITYLIVVLLIVLAAFGIYKWRHKTPENRVASGGTPARNQISLFQNAKTPDEMRTLAAAYEGNGEYDKSKAEWQKIANQTNATTDWWSLLTICATYQVSGRQDCINSAANVLKGRTGSLDFKTAYAIGSQLEVSGHGGLAVPFYQRAVNVYAVSQDKDVSYPSKAQIQGKINELNK